mmetsp:Transcript_9880/g.26821  ORF Transcript_9880/g.26821 Transcript_9880/m.26821 type:complete len:229 (+) Transcript_9880:1880-2566(+)
MTCSWGTLMTTSPRPLFHKPAMARRMEVLPAPEGPMMSSGLPCWTWRLRPSINRLAPSGVTTLKSCSSSNAPWWLLLGSLPFMSASLLYPRYLTLMPGPRSPRLPAPSLEAPTASDVSDAALEERADPAPFACASCSELGDAADAGSCAGSDEPSGDCFKDMASWNWPRRSIIALKPASDSNWYTTSETSVRMWLNADTLWLITPNSILPWKNKGATTAAGSNWIRNL